MNSKTLLLCSLLFALAQTTFGQNVTSLKDTSSVVRQVKPSLDKKVYIIKQTRNDSLYYKYYHKLSKLSKKFDNFKYERSDTLSNPYYIYIFTRPTYYTAAMHETIGKLKGLAASGNEADFPRLLSGDKVTPEPLLTSISKALSHVYSETPNLIVENEDSHLSEKGIRADVNKEVKPIVKLTEKVEQNQNKLVDDFKADDWIITVHKPNFWKIKANIGLQIMQNFVSDNWYKGGESNYSWLATSIIEANYNNKQKITFDNKLEMKLGFQSSKGDEEHKFRSNSDQIRLTNKLGLRATKHWYYTFTLQSWTQFYPGYRKNDAKVYSDFMSPFEMVPSLGMDYKLNLKKFTLSATISPFAGNFKYVDRKALATAFGVTEGKHSKFDFGSNVTIRFNWNIMKNVSWNGRIFYFTDYSTTRVEWENNINLRINQFLTTQFFIYPRFDDGVKRKDDNSYFQFKEWLSLGFNYNF